MFGFSGVPAHCLACDGSAVSRTTYPELFAAIGTTWGAGDGSTTFNLPDFTSVGAFLRSTGGNAAALGTEQGDAIRNINGTLNNFVSTLAEQSLSGALYATISSYGSQSATGNAESSIGSNLYTIIKLDISRSVPTAAENRPVNFAVNICVVYE